jgi:outer-membrane receptor for ferric coprogen and ferric-rhodotorulic acid
MLGIPLRRLMLAYVFIFTGTVMAQALSFDIPKGDLRAALDAYSRQSGVQIIYRVDEMRGVASPGAHGVLDPLAALDVILAHTGFTARHDSSGALAIVKASTAPKSTAPPSMAPSMTSSSATSPSPPSAPSQAPTSSLPAPAGADTTLDKITVTARIEGLAAMRVPTPLKEIPQSVSIISQDLLQQQNDTELAEAFNWATGITVVQNTSADNSFYSRGFQITTLHIDGGPPLALTTSNTDNTPTDLSEYDHIEVLRGADALFGGAGMPGATVSLVRKQPLAQDQVLVSASVGSWNDYRVEGDATGPLGFGGALRGRLVAVGETQDYFYDTADNHHGKVYGILAYDLTPDTLLTAGGSYELQSGIPDYSGLPRYDNGDDPHLPRSTSLVFPWNQRTQHTVEAFAGLEHKFNSDWKLKVNVVQLDQTTSAFLGEPNGSINPVTQVLGGVYGGPDLNAKLDQTGADATLTGAFSLFGRRHELIVGADYQRSPNTTSTGLYFLTSPINPFAFNPGAYSAPTGAPTFTAADSETQKQYGLYMALRLHPWDGWSLIGGVRDSWFKTSIDENEYLGPSILNVVLISQSSSHTDAAKLTPYGGVVYDINKQYSLYASYADIFASNNGATTVNGTVLPAADGVNLEAGIKGAWYGGALNGSLAWFKIDESGIGETDPNAAPSSINNICCDIAGTQKSQGVEIEFSGALTPNWMISTGYTFDINKDIDGSTLTTSTPRHLFKLWTDYRLPGGWNALSIGGGILAQSSNYATGTACNAFDGSGNCIGSELPFNITQGFYAVESLRFAYRISSRWTASLNVNNVFDRIYYQTIGETNSGNWYGAPRNFLLKIQGRL